MIAPVVLYNPSSLSYIRPQSAMYCRAWIQAGSCRQWGWCHQDRSKRRMSRNGCVSNHYRSKLVVMSNLLVEWEFSYHPSTPTHLLVLGILPSQVTYIHLLSLATGLQSTQVDCFSILRQQFSDQSVGMW